jgi:hypothetical protein
MKKDQIEIFEKVRPVQIDLGVADYKAEEVKALYFNKDALVEPPYKLFRLDGKGGDRQYYEFDGKGKPHFYLSVTTFIGKALPTSPHLIKWIADMGEAAAEAYKNERAAYGTFLHGAIEQLLINRKYDLNKLEDVLAEYLERKELKSSLLKGWVYELKKDILAFAQFMLDHNVQPMAIEIMLRSKRMGIAGAIDIVCKMDIEEKGEWGEVYKSGANKGKPKETKKLITIKAIIDVKSGRKGFYETHELQLHGYKKMFEENFPKTKIDRVYNWSGSAWRSSPTYKLKDQTESPIKNKMDLLIKIAQIDWDKTDRELLIMQGVIDIASETIESNYHNTTMFDLVKKKQAKKTGKKTVTAKKKVVLKAAPKNTAITKVVGGGESIAKEADKVIVVKRITKASINKEFPMFKVIGTSKKYNVVHVESGEGQCCVLRGLNIEQIRDFVKGFIDRPETMKDRSYWRIGEKN